jgi:hypothetical protein
MEQNFTEALILNLKINFLFIKQIFTQNFSERIQIISSIRAAFESISKNSNNLRN